MGLFQVVTKAEPSKAKVTVLINDTQSQTAVAAVGSSEFVGQTGGRAGEGRGEGVFVQA